MKLAAALIITGAMIALAGCNPSTSGGPGTATPESEKPMIGQTDNTFKLSAPMMATKLDQGDTETFSVGINRGTDFNQDVTLIFEDVPAGLSVAPNKPTIRSTDEKADVTISASDNATVGDFTIRITGRPSSGSDATTEMSVSVGEREVEEAATAESETWRADRDAYIADMREELAVLESRYEDLKSRASDAQGPAKEDLDRQLARARQNLEAASKSLDEMEKATPDRWDTMKTGFSAAMQDLKSMFE